jgi:hypothetical protein
MPPRLKPTRLEYVVDGVRLRAQLSAAALEASGDLAQRKAALDILKAALFRGRMIAKERLENGAGGIETSRLLSGVTDEVITALWDFTTVHIFRARNPWAGMAAARWRPSPTSICSSCDPTNRPPTPRASSNTCSTRCGTWASKSAMLRGRWKSA